MNFTFSAACFSETWLDDLPLSANPSNELPNYKCKHQVQDNHKGSGVSISIHNP